MKAVTAAILAAAALGGCIVAWQAGLLDSLTDKSHGAIAACEAETLARLSSPSSYVRHKVEYFSKPPLTFEEGNQLRDARERQQYPAVAGITAAYSRNVDREGPRLARRKARGEKLSEDQAQMLWLWQETEKRKAGDDERIARALPADRSALITLEFDAENEYGASLRRAIYCRFDSLGEDGRYAERDILELGPVEEYKPTSGELRVISGEIKFED